MKKMWLPVFFIMGVVFLNGCSLFNGEGERARGREGMCPDGYKYVDYKEDPSRSNETVCIEPIKDDEGNYCKDFEACKDLCTRLNPQNKWAFISKGKYVCYRALSDAGKHCFRQSDCEKACVPFKDSSDHGVCQSHDRRFINDRDIFEEGKIIKSGKLAD